MAVEELLICQAGQTLNRFAQISSAQVVKLPNEGVRRKSMLN